MKDNKLRDRKQSITMYEIAQLAGVSQSTVSRVLNGNTPVAPEKYAAVMEVIERMNYQPNTAAQGLVKGKTSTIGILTRSMGSPFYGELLRGIADGLRKSSYHPVIGLGAEPAAEDRAAIDLLLARRVDALILVYSENLTDAYLHEIAEQLPVVIVGRQVPGLEKRSVFVDNAKGGYAATSYLINKGHTGIAHITGSIATRDAIARRDAYCQALTDYGIEVDPELIVEGDFSEASGALAMDRLLSIRDEHPFSAIFAANDQTAMGARLVLYNRQIQVPNDVSLIGYDDLPSSEYLTPPLTTIRQPVYFMGLMATKAVLAAIIGESFSLPEFPGDLIVRQSVAIVSSSSRNRTMENSVR